jgi:cytosine/adenosine deaminase-related metal-dependent hydrolase
LSPSANPISTVVLYAKEDHVNTVMVAGKILKRNGKLLNTGLPELLKEARKSASKILTEMANPVLK